MYRFLVRKPEGKRPLVIPRRRWVVNIRIGLWGEGVYRVLVGKPEGRDHWGDLGLDGWLILGWFCLEMGRIGYWWGNRWERGHWGDVGVDGWLILGWVFGERPVYIFLVEKPEGKKPLGRPRRICLYNIRMVPWGEREYRFLMGKPEGKIPLGIPRR